MDESVAGKAELFTKLWASENRNVRQTSKEWYQ